ncbi:MAG: 50S ribosomal protein L2 [Nanoarchaeota archaeon]|nr:50S ribosomal protein L2 [Nanoarchaeota archaeon]
MKIYKPTSPGRRGMIGSSAVLSKKKPLKRLLTFKKNRAGRNSAGRITVRHQGGGHKKRYRMLDFKQKKYNIPGRVEEIEYDPYRSGHIARVLYSDGERAYILAPDGMRAGDTLKVLREGGETKDGIRAPLKHIPSGASIHNVEIFPGRGGSIARSAGSAVQLLGNEGKYAHVKMPSGEIRKILNVGYATIGKVSNPEHNLENLGKAGRSRWMGRRPTVRGSAMNPVDHPYGGGEGKAVRGTKRPKTKWGKVTGGRKTRNKKKWSNKLIIQRRKTKR